jgi:peptide/nickel transport system permease protein
MTWARFLSRLAQAVVVMFGVTTVMFVLVRAVPGNPATSLAGPGATPATIAALRAQYHLNEPVPEQYLHWLSAVVTGNLGTSLAYKVPVMQLIGQSLQPSLQLLAAAMIIGVPLGMLIGVTAATHRRGRIDMLFSGLTAGALAMPDFWTGVLLLLIFSAQLHWLPAGGWVSVFSDPIAGLRTLVLPAVTLAIGVAVVQARFVRSAMIEVLTGDYVRTARAKGASERRVIWNHALRNALLPVLTVSGIQVGVLLGGVVVIENVFARPGLGTLITTGISNRDYPVVQGVTLVLVATFCVLNLGVDLLYAVLDPRVRR